MGFKWSYWTCASHLLKTLLLQRCLVKTESELKKQSEERQKMAACTSFENTAFFLLARELLLYEQYHKLILPPSTSSAGEKQQTTRVHCSKSCKKCPWLSRELWTSTITRIWAHQNSKCLLVSLAPPSLCFCMCVCAHAVHVWLECICVQRPKNCLRYTSGVTHFLKYNLLLAWSFLSTLSSLAGDHEDLPVSSPHVQLSSMILGIYLEPYFCKTLYQLSHLPSPSFANRHAQWYQDWPDHIDYVSQRLPWVKAWGHAWDCLLRTASKRAMYTCELLGNLKAKLPLPWFVQ